MSLWQSCGSAPSSLASIGSKSAARQLLYGEFVHVMAIQAAGLRGLYEGQQVQFDIEADKRGPKAVNLKLVGDAEETD